MLRLDATHPGNRQALSRLREQAPEERPLVPAAEAVDPYHEAGTHPDVVEWVWDRLGNGLPPEGRCLVYGRPCLVQPVSGVLLAIGYGTQYLVRLLEADVPSALAAGCVRVHRWGGSAPDTNASEEFGPDWVFGSFSDRMRPWLHATYRHLDTPPAAGATLLDAGTPAERVEREGLTLEVREGPDLERRALLTDVTPETIARTVGELRWSSMTFVTLQRDGDNWLEISGSLQAGDGLSASCLVDGVESVSQQPPDLATAVTLLQAYSRADADWQDLIRWE